jgi:hypothetical protein
MTDIYIRISDEDGATLNAVNIHEDGSDIEYAEEIVDWLLSYDGAQVVDEVDIP